MKQLEKTYRLLQETDRLRLAPNLKTNNHSTQKGQSLEQYSHLPVVGFHYSAFALDLTYRPSDDLICVLLVSKIAA